MRLVQALPQAYRRLLFSTFVVVGTLAFPTTASADEPNVLAEQEASELRYAAEVRRELGVSPEYDRVAGLSNVKIAIIDNSFARFEKFPESLPKTTVLIKDYTQFITDRGYDYARTHGLYVDLVNDENDPSVQRMHVYPGKEMSDSDHGRRMAQALWAVSGKKPEGPQFYLLNGRGQTNFKRAIRYAIDEIKPQIILCSMNFESLAGFDEVQSFAHRWINEATDAGILWVNAAGNYGAQVVNAPVRVGKNGYVLFGEGEKRQDYLEVSSLLDENSVQVTLVWNAFPKNENSGTDKDLDLEFYDLNGKRMNLAADQGSYRQVIKGSGPDGRLADEEAYLPSESLGDTADNPLILFRAQPKHTYGAYFLRVRVKGGVFDPESDRLRLVLKPAMDPIFSPEERKHIDVVSWANLPILDRGSNIFFPAGNPNVITVGDGSDYSAFGKSRRGSVSKPEITLPKILAQFSSGGSSEGSSFAAAYFAGAMAVLLAHEPRLTRADILTLVANEQARDRSSRVTPSRLTIDEALQLHPVVTRQILKTVGPSARFFSVPGETAMQVEVGPFNKSLKEFFPRFRWDAFTEDPKQFGFYVAVSGREPNRVLGVTRQVTADEAGEVAPFPWEALDLPRDRFVEIRAQIPGAGNFVLPTQAALRRLYR